MYEDEEDELSEPIDPMTRWSLVLMLFLGVIWGIFITARRSHNYDLADQLLLVAYGATLPVGVVSLILGLLALRRLRRKGFAHRGLAVIGVAASSVALLAWLFFTLYRLVIR